MVWIDGWGLIYGLGPIDLVNTSVPLPESIEEQTRKIVRNLDAILKDRQLSRRHVVAVRAHLIDFQNLRERFQNAWSELFPADENSFAMSCVRKR